MCSGDGVCDSLCHINGVKCANHSLIQLYDATTPGYPAYPNNKIPIAQPRTQLSAGESCDLSPCQLASSGHQYTRFR